jgi:hypothetical protein
MKTFMTYLGILFFTLPALPQNTQRDEVIQLLKGAKVFAQDDETTYLGKFSATYDSESIFNEYGLYGSEYNISSIWNEYADFGSPYSDVSAFNKFATKPPVILKNGKVIGYITVNKNINQRISPYILKDLKEDF